MDPAVVIASLVLGAAAAGLAYYGREYYDRFVDLMQADLGGRVRAMRIRPERVRPYIHLWLGATAAVGLIVWLYLDRPVFALLGAGLLVGVPWWLVARMDRRRRQKIEDQLADALVTFSSAVRAGLSLAQALELLANECPKPLALEFRQIVGEYKMGKPLERTLTEAKERLRSENFVLFAAALLASRESGGKLNETVERISKSILELQRLERKVQSETAQARKSAVYMAMVPPIILVVFWFVDPDNTALLFNTFVGQMLLATAVLLNVIAYFWAARILKADI